MDSEPEKDTRAKTQAVIAVILQLQVCYTLPGPDHVGLIMHRWFSMQACNPLGCLSVGGSSHW